MTPLPDLAYDEIARVLIDEAERLDDHDRPADDEPARGAA
jgi:hypothetical protein